VTKPLNGGYGRAVAADAGGRAEGERVAGLRGLQPLPDEGGLYRRTFADAHSSAIYYLLLAPDFSALHRLRATETYHWYAGSPLRLLLLRGGGGDTDTDGQVEEPTLGPDLDAGERPQTVVPAGTWQGSTPVGSWSLVGTTMAPPFAWSGFELGARAELIDRWPSARDRITALTRR
jgi:predicted cupin superfamily sugar epimerase